MEDKEKVEYENRRVLYRMIVNSFGNEKIFLKQMRYHNAYNRFNHIIELMNKQIITEKVTYADVIKDSTIGRLIMDLMADLHKK